MNRLKLLLALLFVALAVQPAGTQVTNTTAVLWPLVDVQEGRNSPGPVRSIGWTDSYVMWENTTGKILKAVRPDTTRLDSLTKKYDRYWTFQVATKADSSQYIWVTFNITEGGRRARSNATDTTLAIPLHGSGLYITDYVAGLDLWFNNPDSLRTGDESRVYFYHSNFVQHTPAGVQKVTTSW
ncbi:MAG: hypothetical protein AAB538_05910 [Patescibacteria group bacterium]